MKVLLSAFILFLFCHSTLTNKIKNSDIYEFTKEILNSFAYSDKFPFIKIDQNQTHNKNKKYNSNSTSKKPKVDKNKTFIGLSDYQINVKKLKTEAEILREEFLMVINKNETLYKNKTLNSISNNMNFSNPITNKTNETKDLNFLKKSESFLYKNLKQNNKLRYNTNSSINCNKISNNVINKIFKEKILLSTNKNQKVIKNHTIFLEFDSDIRNKNQIVENKSTKPFKMNNKEDKKLLLLRLKNLMEKYIDIKQKKDKKKKDIWLADEERKMILKYQGQLNNFDDINNYKKKKKNTFPFNLNKIKQLKKEKKYLEEKLQNKTINSLRQQKFIKELQKESKINSQKYDKSISDMKFKHSPKNLIIKQPKIIMDQNNDPLKLPKEIMQVSNDFLTPKINTSLNKSMKAYIPLEECNRNWDYKLHGDDWQCMVNINFIKYFNIISVNAEKDNPQLMLILLQISFNL